ncbi:hypothetical protein GCM10023322_65840 [Rugosimonospora acidiphila]|uniref:Uncharacterized protein n=1 Tax=Rugosimonospora acidiphila TaxID=556531 RepID=A0ABP9SL40_9ACTN
MSRDRSLGKNGTASRNRAAAAMEDTDPMTREELLEACGLVPESSASGMSRGERGQPDSDSDDPRPAI